ncbi:hypothetical protein UFOVP577_23 [uncultured Caudovirales phage]|uniref:Uncharacterized protein n=1 Tax=uncultured Caudovirales phage TaxID=2100421 RepID=A0A6J5MUV1_9CAUD|nr:hypothetical protein UFOVP577_23 [uncultured Caudovirales phage]
MVTVTASERKIGSRRKREMTPTTNPSTHGLRLSRAKWWMSAHFRRGLKPSRRWVFLLGYTASGNESNSDASGECYWWLWSETAQKRVAKLVPLTERLTGVVAPEGMTEGAFS